MRHVAHRGRICEEDEAHSREISKRFARPLPEWHCPTPSQPPVATGPTPLVRGEPYQAASPGAGTLRHSRRTAVPGPGSGTGSIRPCRRAPCARRAGGDAHTVDAPSLDLHDGADVETPEADGVHVREVPGEQRVGPAAPSLPGEVAARLLLDVIFWTSSRAARRSMRPSWPPRSSCVHRRDRSAEAESLPRAPAHGSTLNSAAARCSPAPRIPPAGARQPGTLLPR